MTRHPIPICRQAALRQSPTPASVRAGGLRGRRPSSPGLQPSGRVPPPRCIHAGARRSRPPRALAPLAALCLASLLLLTTLPPPAAGAEPIFGPPLTGPPGPDRWFVSQWYGNTVWAYQNRSQVYGTGQGIHFGVDLATPCGTPVLAVGDGTIFAVDGPYGSAPHNLVIRHPNGLFSLYGHLLERPTIAVGTAVRAGQPVALSGDPAGERCDIEPHLHLEIRRAAMTEAINPVPLVALDWQRAAIGLRRNGLRFAIDLDDPTPWTTPADQPDITFGQRLINDFPRVWP